MNQKLSQEQIDLEVRIQEASKIILALQPDFDEKGCIPPAKELLDTACEYLRFLFECCGDRFPMPDIGVGPEESVDVLFEGEKWKILLNFGKDKKIDWACFLDGKCLSSCKLYGFENKTNFANLFCNTYVDLAMSGNP